MNINIGPSTSNSTPRIASQMRPSLFLRALPPIPPPSQWKKTFPSPDFTVVNRLRAGGKNNAQCRRTQPIDDLLADELVKSFGIAEGTHVIEAFPGMGFITRALLRRPPSHIPSVLAIEPALSFLKHGLGFPEHKRTSTLNVGEKLIPPTPVEEDESQSGLVVGEWGAETRWHVHQSEYDDRLKIADNSIYQWDTVNALKTAGYFDSYQVAKWEEGPPNVHLVAHIPDSSLGEQLVSQWLTCIASKSWLFQYGRMKMSLIVSAGLFDRLVAVPRDRAYCKLSVIRAAVADFTPSHPDYIHIDIPASLKARLAKKENTVKVPRGRRSSKEMAKASEFGTPPPSSEVELKSEGPEPMLMSCDPKLYYPRLRPRNPVEKLNTGVLSRPGMMGLTLEPLVDGPLKADDKDCWDYVTRKLFVVQGSTLAAAIKNLGPGSENLLPLLLSPDLPLERRIDSTKQMREFDTHDWSNLVEVFKNWKFAPEVLTLQGNENRMDHHTRNMGVSA